MSGREQDPVGRVESGEARGAGGFERHANRIWYSLLAVCAGLLGGDLLYHKHVEFDFEGWFGFYAVFGFVAFFFIVLAGKQLRKVLMRAEDYYDE